MASDSNSDSSSTPLNLCDSINFDARASYDSTSVATAAHLDFAEEWKLLVDSIQEIVHSASRPPPPQRLRSATIPPPHYASQAALDIFLSVFQREYENKHVFQSALLQALTQSLGDKLCHKNGTFKEIPKGEESISTTNTKGLLATTAPSKVAQSKSADDALPANNTKAAQKLRLGCDASRKKPARTEMIWLGNSNIGFATNIDQSDLKLSYYHKGQARRSKCNIASVMFNKHEGVNVIDIMTVAQLALQSDACQEFVAGSRPNFASAHAPLGQALVYARYAWYSMARRGYCTESGNAMPVTLPAFVLAARQNDDSSPHAHRLCGVGASLCIPQQLGGPFRYQIDQCVRFPAQQKDADALYTQAICGFVKTMRIGLTFAQNLQGESKPAVSLCCSPPHSDLQLMASPIPCANQPSSSFRIFQGELYRYTGEETSVGDWIRGLQPRKSAFLHDVFLFGSSESTMSGIIVKVTCKTVHCSLVASRDNLYALCELDRYGNEDLKSQIGKVLLGCRYLGDRCGVMVMKDLSPSGEDPPFDGFENPHARWEAFSRLVKNILFPMACVGVVHTDIRFDPANGRICNVLPTRNENGTPCELSPIDFESLAIYADVPGNMQKYAISIGHLDNFSEPAHMFLFWQIVWVAYGFWTESEGAATLQEAYFLVKCLFSKDERFVRFEQKFRQRQFAQLKAAYESLRGIETTLSAVCENGIVETLRILGLLFH
jgi:hypothetical protein